ncbi:MAG: UvrD-helicase domain-containing protein [Bacilli bacterium]|nr:UvrD-helicase domain-containing protein [Bacilli bacterium]
MEFKRELNENQYKAVTTSSQYVRVVAGAGSGKTRVLTYRIAYLLSEMDVAPWAILAITFTNKVAAEMRTRVIRMISNDEKDLTIRTFHSFAANFLRREISVLGFPSSFTILDEEDQTKMIKDIAAEMGYKRGDKIVGKTLNYIGSMKLQEKYPEDINIVKPHFEDERTCLEMYTRYEEMKNNNLSLDFDDLLLKTNYILENFPEIRLKWQNRYEHILIDEFQDTNNIEYKLVKYLLNPNTSLYVVGDPDQTIYTWRGANQKIILELEKEFSRIETIILDRNYRSTQNILDSANSLIAHNKLRVKKNLYTESLPGEKVVVKAAVTAKAEADYVAKEINKLVQFGHYSYSDIALLYRSNYVTMEFETALTKYQIPYEIYGGTKFYQRREIKDVLAYFHLIVNTRDDVSFERIINVPRRGIGETTINIIKQEARDAKKSMYNYILEVDPDNSEIPSKAINALQRMIRVISDTRDAINANEEVFSKTIEQMIWDFGYLDYLLKEDDGDERIENVKALFSDIRHFLMSNPDSTFDEYLQNISLLSAQDEMVTGDHITLMTVHTAKGLEFPVVFIVRFNDGVFPNQRALNEDGYLALEEERRLAYVAMTRAKEKLYITFSNDFSYVLGGTYRPSQFIMESNNEIINERMNNVYTPKARTTSYNDRNIFNDGDHITFGVVKEEPKRQNFDQNTNGIEYSEWKIGDTVLHKKFGEGRVVALDGDGIITVNFFEHGLKTIMGNHPFVSKGGK